MVGGELLEGALGLDGFGGRRSIAHQMDEPDLGVVVDEYRCTAVALNGEFPFELRVKTHLC